MTKSVRFANTITALFSRGGGESVSYLLAAVLALGAAGSAQADDVVDLGGETVEWSASNMKANVGKTVTNGTINLNDAIAAGTLDDGWYTFGENIVLNHVTGPFQIGGAKSVKLIDGASINFSYSGSGHIGFGQAYNSNPTSLVLENGHVDCGNHNIYLPYANTANKTVNMDVMLNNGSTLTCSSSGYINFGSIKASTKVKAVHVNAGITNSTITAKEVDLGVASTTLTDKSGSYNRISFGPESHINCQQMYANPYPAPTVTFDGATIHKTPGGYNSFIGHAASLGDIYTIDAGGLTIDIPSDVELICDQNASSLKGAGGVTKIGEGSITWNKVSSGGSSGMTFNGPLVVSNGTWTSTLGYAASAFKVDGANSTLELSGALSATDVAFEATDGGTLTLADATIADTTPDMTLAGGGTTDYFTRDGAVAAYTLGTLTLGEDAVLDLKGDSAGVDTISATALALSATAANKVTIGFSDAANVLGGTHDLVTITGGSTFAAGDLAKFALDEKLPEGSVLSLSEDLTRLVLTVPASNPATWTGGANDNNLLSPLNWLGKVVPGADADVIISVDSATTLTCNDAFSVKSITFPSTSAQVTISGSGCITNATEIVNVSEARPVINVPVEFVANADYAAIDVTGEVDFSGGVTGTVPANHTTFYGNYTLMAETWTLSEAITLAEGAKVKAEGMTINISTANSKFICAEPGSSLELVGIYTAKTGDVFGSYKGVLHVGSITIDTGSSSTSSFQFGTGFTGVLKIGHFLVYPGTGTVWAFPYATVVMGGTGFHLRRGSLPLGGISSGQTVDEYVIHSSADWTMKVENGNDYNFAIRLSAPHIVVDTSDYGGDADGHTVTIKHESKAQAAARLLEGPGALAASGNGALVFQNTCYFTGGLTASNSVTVGVNAGVSPGNGNVTLKDTSILDLRGSPSGTAAVNGTLTMTGGTTLRISTLASGVLPLSVNALAFTGESKVTLDINGGTLADGYYPLIKSATTLPAEAVEAFVLDVNEAVELPAGAETSLVAQGDTLFLQVGDVSDLPSGVWVGGVDSNMSNPLNWKNLSVPAAGGDLDFSGVSSAATVNADIDDAFGAVTMGTGVVTFTGALTATLFSDTSKVAVGADATVTLDGDLALDDQPTDILVGRVDAGGQFIVTGNVVANDKNINPVGAAGSGYIVVGGLQVNGSDKWLYSTKDRTSQNWAFGPGGISGAGGIWCRSNNANDSYFHVYTNDFKISVNTVIRSAVDHHELNTTGFRDSLPHTITLEGGLADRGLLFIAGTGKVVVDSVPVAFGGYPAYSGAVTVKDTATLSINAGKMISTGTITVNSGAALEVAQSGTVALGGDLTLADGACLGFNFSTRDAPVLNLTDRTVTFEEGETTNVTVRISADAGARAHGGKNVLTTGVKFAGATVTLAEGAPSWASDVTVENGEIVLSVKPVGLAVFVR